MKNDLDERIEQASRSNYPILNLDEEIPYEQGQELTVSVNAIVNYGVFVDVLDGYAGSGLIHIKNIADQFIEDIGDWFEVGQEIQGVRVLDIKDGKLNLSTKHLNLKPINEENQLHHKLKNYQIRDSNDPITKEEVSTEESIMDKDLKGIFDRLTQEVGVLSPDAKKLIEATIQEHGVYVFTVSMMKTLQHFSPDLSLYLATLIKDKIGDGL